MPIAAIIQLALLMLPKVTVGVEEFIAWINKLRAAAQQSGEWTLELESAYVQALYEKSKDPAYQQDSPS